MHVPGMLSWYKLLFACTPLLLFERCHAAVSMSLLVSNAFIHGVIVKGSAAARRAVLPAN